MVISALTSGKSYRLLPDKENPAQALNSFVVQQLLYMRHFVLEFRKSSQKIERVNLKLTCFVVQG